MLEQLKNAAQHITSINSKTRECAEDIRKKNPKLKEGLEKEIITTTKKIKINKKIGAVDCGILSKEMQGIDLIIGRPAGVIFQYENSKLKKTEYYPKSFPEPKYEVKFGLDEFGSLAFKNLYRLNLEISCAIELIEKYDLEIILLDGSVSILAQDRPNEESGLMELYIQVINLYKKLYQICKDKNILLIGVVKDSKGKRFLDELNEKDKINSSDTIFLDYLLKKDERTCAIRLTKEPKKHPVFKDLGEWAEKLNLFYIKPVENDRPVRIEFLGDDYETIASVIQTLSAINQNYAYPAILIEVDLRSMIDFKEMERMEKTLFMLSGAGFSPLKRNSRPFR
ncbi:MAG: DNA double-strand break repair nuclease NurA [Candidatus Micrarchaeia archaeon]